MSILAAVVALATIDTFARHVSVTAARITSLSLASAVAAAAAAAAVAATVGATTVRFGAVPSYVSDLTALIALLRTTLATTNGAAALGALTADVATLTASVASLAILHTLGTVTAEMTLVAAIVTFRCATVGAVAGLMSCLAAIEARARGSGVIHGDENWQG
jgi:hypothetical protein